MTHQCCLTRETCAQRSNLQPMWRGHTNRPPKLKIHAYLAIIMLVTFTAAMFSFTSLQVKLWIRHNPQLRMSTHEGSSVSLRGTWLPTPEDSQRANAHHHSTLHIPSSSHHCPGRRLRTRRVYPQPSASITRDKRKPSNANM